MKYDVELWKDVTVWTDEGYPENKKKFIGCFPSYKEAKRYIRNVLVPWRNREWEWESYEEWDSYGWFPGLKVPKEYERKWKVNAFRFQGDHKETGFYILRPLS